MLRRRLARAERRRARRLGLVGVAGGALATGLSFASPARATTVNEFADFGDFGDTFATRSFLPDGTDVVTGSVQFTVEPPFFIETPDLDFIAFTDLVPGASFSLDVTNAFGDAALVVSVLDGTGALLFPTAFPAVETTQNFSGTVPLSGELGLRLQHGQDSNAYTVALDAPRVPEPGSAALLASLALARSFLRRRRV